MHDTFVSIACYRDVDVINTVRSMLSNAAFPENLRIVVVIQDDPSRWHLYHPIHHQAELYYFDATWSEGAGKARAEVLKHYMGERYFFQSDSHMRFDRNWDQMLRLELLAAGEKPILTTFPPNFDLQTDVRDHPTYNHIMLKDFYQKLPMTIAVSTNMSNYKATATPRSTAFIAAGVLFTYGKFIQEVPCDPYFYFTGEEITIAVRAWTHGWTCYSPRFCFCYHAYRNERNRKLLPLSEMDPARDMFFFNRSIERAQILLGLKGTYNALPTSVVDLHKYGLGNMRSLQSWEQTYGINLQQSTAEPWALYTAC